MNNVILIKCGGSILAELSSSFFTSIKELKEQGNKIIIVHGGGPEIEAMLTSLSINSEFVNGLRKTTSDVLEVAEMVLAGSVNKKLVTKMNQTGLKAIGLSGCDGQLLEAKAINKDSLGYVGEVTAVNDKLLNDLLALNYVPIIAPIGVNSKGEKYNINADTAAAAVALALNAKQLMFVTNVPGILKDGNVLETVSVKQIHALISEGTIYGGMIPKVNAAMSALSEELSEITIVSGRDSLLNSKGHISGTTITKELEAV